MGDVAALEETTRALCHVWNGPGTLLMTVDEHGSVHESLEPSIAALPPERLLVHERVDAAAVDVLEDRWPGRVQAWNLESLYEEMHPWWLVAPEIHTGSVLWEPQPRDGDDRTLASVLWGEVRPGDVAVLGKRLAIRPDERGFDFGLLRDQVSRQSPLEWAARYTEYHEHVNGLSQLVLYVFEHRADFVELVQFWNFRARYGRRRDACTVVGLQADLVGDSAAGELVKRWAVDSSWATKPDVRVSTVAGRVSSVEAWLVGSGMTKVEGSRWTSFASVPESRARPEFAIVLSSIPHRLRRGRGADTVVTLAEGVTPVHLPIPEGLPGSLGWQGLARVELSGLPLAFPMSDALAATCIVGSSARGARSLTSVVSPPVGPLRMNIRLPDASVQLDRHMASVDLRAAVSSAGKIALPLIGRVSQTDGLDALATPFAVAVLSALTSPSRIKLARRVRDELKTAELADIDEVALVDMLREEGLFSQHQSLTVHNLASALSVKQRQLLPAVSALSAAGFLQRGLSVACPQCDSTEFWTLRELDEEMRCRACRIAFPLPATQNGTETPISYRLDGLVARAMDQDLVPVLLTLRYLLRSPEVGMTPQWWPGLDLYERDASTNSFEIDLLVADSGSLWVCEVKASASALSRPEAVDHIGWAGRIGGRPVFTALEGEWNEDALALVDEYSDCLFLGPECLFSR
jgi:hypothetical protein